MRFVPIKTPDDQALALSYKTRSLLIAQRTAVVNSLREGNCLGDDGEPVVHRGSAKPAKRMALRARSADWELLRGLH